MRGALAAGALRHPRVTRHKAARSHGNSDKPQVSLDYNRIPQTIKTAVLGLLVARLFDSESGYVETVESGRPGFAS